MPDRRDKCLSASRREVVGLAREHIAIVSRSVAAALVNGTKRVETRFYRQRRIPFGRVRAGDIVHFKISGGDVIGSSQVAAIEELTELTPARIAGLQRTYGRQVRAPATYWAACRNSRYGLLIWLGPLAPAPDRLAVPRQFGGAWMVLRR